MKELKNAHHALRPKAHHVQPPGPAPQAPAGRRLRGHYLIYTLAGALLILLGLILRVHDRRQSASDKELQKAATQASPQLAGVVAVDQEQLRQVSVEPVGERTIAIDRDTTGRVAFNEERLTPVFTPYAGRAAELPANKGDYVKRGQPLAVLESPDIVNAQNALVSARSDLVKARIGLDIARTSAERARRLQANEALATRELQQAEADLARAEDEYRRSQAAVTAAENLLAMFGKRPDEIAQAGAQVDRRMVIHAPISGTVVDRKIGPGQFVKPDSPDPLFLISDLSTLWVQADVFESDLAGVRAGAPVEISVAAYPGRTFPARISMISPTVDPATRTIRMRCVLNNPGGLLKPDMFARIKIIAATRESVPVVPSRAVVTVGTDSFVFVEEAPGRFRRRQVQVGRDTDGHVAVDSGLQPGERVATAGALLLNELSKK